MSISAAWEWGFRGLGLGIGACGYRVGVESVGFRVVGLVGCQSGQRFDISDGDYRGSTSRISALNPKLHKP